MLKISIASESKTVFSTRVTRDNKALKTGVASLQNTPIYAGKKSWFTKMMNFIIP